MKNFMFAERWKKIDRNDKGLGFGLLSVLLWGVPPFLVAVLAAVHSLFIILGSEVISLITALVFVFILIILKTGDLNMLIENFKPKNWILVGLSGSSQALSFILLYYAIHRGNPIASIIIYHLWPLWFTIMMQLSAAGKERIAGGITDEKSGFSYNSGIVPGGNKTERINRFQWVVLILAVIGAYFVVTGKTHGMIKYSHNYFYLLLAFVSSVLGALNFFFYKTAARDIVEKGSLKLDRIRQHGILTIARVFCGLIITFPAWLILSHSFPVISFSLILFLSVLGVVTGFLSHTLFNFALYNTKPPEILAVASNFTPVVSLILFWIVLDRTVSVISLAGAGLILLCVKVFNSDEKYLTIDNGIIMSVAIIAILMNFLPRGLGIGESSWFTVTLELAATIYGIMTGFVLMRLYQRTVETDRLLIGINELAMIIRDASKDIAPEDKKFKKNIISLMENLLRIDAYPLKFKLLSKIDGQEKAAVQKIKNMRKELLDAIFNLKKIAKNYILEEEKIFRKFISSVEDWLYIRRLHLSFAEIFALVILAGFIDVGIIVMSSDTLWGNIAAASVIIAVTLIILAVIDYENLRMGGEITFLYQGKQMFLIEEIKDEIKNEGREIEDDAILVPDEIIKIKRLPGLYKRELFKCRQTPENLYIISNEENIPEGGGNCIGRRIYKYSDYQGFNQWIVLNIIGSAGLLLSVMAIVYMV